MFTNPLRVVRLTGRSLVLTPRTPSPSLSTVSHLCTPLQPLNLTSPAVKDLEKYRPGLAKTFYNWFTVCLRQSPSFTAHTNILSTTRSLVVTTSSRLWEETTKTPSSWPRPSRAVTVTGKISYVERLTPTRSTTIRPAPKATRATSRARMLPRNLVFLPSPRFFPLPRDRPSMIFGTTWIRTTN